MRHTKPAATVAVLSLGAFGLACKEDTQDSARGELPPDTAAPAVQQDSGWGSFPVDTAADTGLGSSAPETTLTITHRGSWLQAPEGGPYAEMSGELLLEELLEGDPLRPWCRASFTLSGQALLDEPGCEGCDAVYDIAFLLLSEGPSAEEVAAGIEVGGLAACTSPELPIDGETWRMGWSLIESTVYFDYFDTGVWLPWYAGEQALDQVDFDWTTTVGFHRPEQEAR